MKMSRSGKKGFSMIELLVVLLIIGILAAVAAPLFLTNTVKARVSEAAAGAGDIRSAERTYMSQNGGNPLAVTVAQAPIYFGSQGGNLSAVLGIQIHGNKFFSSDAYSVATGNGLAWAGAPAGAALPAPQDFLITVTGNNSLGLGANATDGAANNGDVGNYIVQMDNTGRTIFTSSGAGGTWSNF